MFAINAIAVFFAVYFGGGWIVLFIKDMRKYGYLRAVDRCSWEDIFHLASFVASFIAITDAHI